MSGPPRAVANVRRAVRESLDDVPAGSAVLVAVSGGADSMALAAATQFVSQRTPFRTSAVVIDHQLQVESERVVDRAAQQLARLGYDAVATRTVVVDTSAPGGPEAAARAARYLAIDQVADEVDATAILLGHTRDDQAESVLLGLARGSGSRSIQGMPPRRGRYRRPLLGLDRGTTRQACRDLSIETWDDPHNHDDRFTRVRVRRHVLPVLEAELGPGVAEALARTAELLRADDSALETWAAEVRQAAHVAVDHGAALDIEVLADVPTAVRLRVVRTTLLDVGVPGGAIRSSHLSDVDALAVRWKGQGVVHLPGRFAAARVSGRLVIDRAG